MNVIHYMNVSIFIVGKSPYEVQQTFLTILEVSTIYTTLELNCNIMVSGFPQPEIYFSRKRRKGERMGSQDTEILGSASHLDLSL